MARRLRMVMIQAAILAVNFAAADIDRQLSMNLGRRPLNFFTQISLRWPAVILLLGVVVFGLTAPLGAGHQQKENVAGAAIRPLPASIAWRRTVRGWERPSDWPVGDVTQSWSPATILHPILVAAVELLISLGALIGFTTRAHGGVIAHRAARATSH